MMFPAFLTSKATIAIAAALAFAGCMFFAYRTGVTSERARMAKQTIELMKQRDAIDGKVNGYDDATLCTRLGGQWVSNECQ